MTKIQEITKQYPDIIWELHPVGVYVSNLGHVTGKHTDVNISLTKKGYRFFCLLSKCYKVYRLVADLHVSNPDNKKCVNHINGIKTDDRASNLEWCTYSENNLHSSHLLNNNSPWTKKAVIIKKADKIVAVVPSVREAAKAVNGNWSNVSKCCSGKRKSHNGYTFQYTKSVIKPHLGL